MASITSRIRTRRGRAVSKVPIRIVGAAVVAAVAAGDACVAVAQPVAEHRAREARDTAGDNSRATREYLGIVRATLVAMEANRGHVESAVEALVARAHDRCGGIAAAAPTGAATWRVEAEITEDVAATVARANAEMANEFRWRADGLRWRNDTITEQVDATARAVDEQAYLASPPLCSGIREWVLSRFARVPRQLAAFARRFETVSDRGTLVPVSVAECVDAGDLGSLRAVRHLEQAFASYVRADILESRAEIVRALGL
jgi:hypothetical protein